MSDAGPDPDLLEAVGLPPDVPAVLAGGVTGSLWKVATADGPRAVRLASSPLVAADHVAAMRAARDAGLPVPEVLARAAVGSGEVLLLSWLPGMPVFDVLRKSPARAFDLGRLLGRGQRRLHDVRAPGELPAVTSWKALPSDAGPGTAALPEGDALLHMDWHGANVLTDGEALTGILDWENARRGHPLLDLARTYTLLTVDPALDRITATERRLVEVVAAGWAAGYGPVASAIPAGCLAWAGTAMARDLEPHYADRPQALDGLRRWTERRARISAGTPSGT